jgi:GT2 family glycosyltransferase
MPDSTADPSVLIVVLNWNSHEETLTAVESIAAMSYANCSTVVIDNGSTDGSVKELSKIEGERVRLVSSPANLGFTGGCNLGIEVALRDGYDYVWLLNNDATTEAGTLASLVRVAEEDEKIGLVSPLIASLQEPAKLLNAGGLYEPETPYYYSTKAMETAREWAAKYPERVMLQGTALLVRVAMVREIGMLDDGFFAYFEDTDLSLRSIKAGYRNAVDFGAVVYHKEKTLDAKYHELKPYYWYYMARNEIRFWKKHAGFRARLRPLWWQYGAQLRYLRELKAAESRRAILAGLWDGWLGRTGIYREERRMPRIFGRIIEMHSEVYKG